MGKKELTIIAVTALIVLVASSKLKSLPGLNKLPTI